MLNEATYDVSLTKGLYPEVFEEDSVVRIGRVWFNTVTEEVIAIEDVEGGYSFGFNGKENDNEVHNATGTSVDFGARIYDSRVGRWLSLDPLAAKYPYISPYVFTADNPILFVDVDGKDFFIRNKGTQHSFKAAIRKMYSKEIAKAFEFDKSGQLAIKVDKIDISKLSSDQQFFLSKVNQLATDGEIKVDVHNTGLRKSQTIESPGKGDYDTEYDIYVNIDQLSLGKKVRDTEGGELKEGQSNFKPDRATLWAIVFGHEVGHTTEDAYGDAPMEGAENFKRTVGFENKIRSILGIKPRLGTPKLHGGVKGSKEPTPAEPLPKQ